jgi:hypothetical protein
MDTLIRLSTFGHPFFGSRLVAREIRLELERALRDRGEVRIDFANVGATQSFIDELVGVLVAQQGVTLLSSLVFTNCSDDIKALLQFVIGSRLRDFDELSKASNHHLRPADRDSIAIA